MTDHMPADAKSASPIRVFLRRWSRTNWADRVLLLEAMGLLGAARIGIAALPFRTIGRLAGSIRRTYVPPNAARTAIVHRVRWAVRACARRAPFRAVCFQQGLAAQIMLRRRGVPSVLYFGAAPDDVRGLVAHVWVRDGNVAVVGGEEAPRFAVLAMFPEGTDSPARQHS